MCDVFRRMGDWLLLPLGPLHFSVPTQLEQLIEVASVWTQVDLSHGTDSADPGRLYAERRAKVEQKMTEFLHVEVGAPNHNRQFDMTEIVHFGTKHAHDKSAPEIYGMFVDDKVARASYSAQEEFVHEQGFGTQSWTMDILKALSDPLQACWAGQVVHDAEVDDLCSEFNGLCLGCKPPCPGSMRIHLAVWGHDGSSIAPGGLERLICLAARLGRPSAAKIALKHARVLPGPPAEDNVRTSSDATAGAVERGSWNTTPDKKTSIREEASRSAYRDHRHRPSRAKGSATPTNGSTWKCANCNLYYGNRAQQCSKCFSDLEPRFDDSPGLDA